MRMYIDDQKGKFVEVNGVQLHYMDFGEAENPVVIFLHGFPEFWYGWRNQIDLLAESGFRVIVPDQRGYNLSAKPKEIRAYNLDEIVKDLTGLIEYLGKKKVYLVGHDYGAAVSWWAANKYPALFERMVILNVPHHRVFGRFVYNNFKQKIKSWYIYLFQIPRLPEFVLGFGNHFFGGLFLKIYGMKGTFSKDDIRNYKRAWSEPGAWQAMLNWYRAMFRKLTVPPPRSKIRVPVLLIWGKSDLALSWEMAQPSVDLCEDGRLEMIDDASHFVQHDRPNLVNQLILDFFSGDES